MTGDGGGGDDLKRAFEILAEIRRQQIPIDIRIAEYPHSGILLDDQGFFEMEWPEGSYRKISALLDDVENNNYRCGFEMGAGCWEKFTRNYGKTFQRMMNGAYQELKNFLPGMLPSCPRKNEEKN